MYQGEYREDCIKCNDVTMQLQSEKTVIPLNISHSVSSLNKVLEQADTEHFLYDAFTQSRTKHVLYKPLDVEFKGKIRSFRV